MNSKDKVLLRVGYNTFILDTQDACEVFKLISGAPVYDKYGKPSLNYANEELLNMSPVREDLMDECLAANTLDISHSEYIRNSENG